MCNTERYTPTLSIPLLRHKKLYIIFIARFWQNATYKYHMFKKLKQWREKWTVDHSVDVAVDLVLLLIDVIASPVLICVRLIRYVIGDYVVNKIKSGLKLVIHWWEKRSKPVRRLLLVLFLIVLPFVLIVVYFFTEIVSMYFEYNWND